MEYLSPDEEYVVADMVANATRQGQLHDLLATAIAALNESGPVQSTRAGPISQKHRETNFYIEVAVRAEAAIHGKGMFFRIKRRGELTKKYFLP